MKTKNMNMVLVFDWIAALTFSHENDLCDFGGGQFDDVSTLTVVPTVIHILVVAHHIIYNIWR